ncbi:MAG: gamma-glutamyltransferase family protein [Mojavia pulchra JT2-VF2]|jgi:gamma-glutamyltranspeptidase/glutathione hydrolase|uniref:Gamma-glutamyltransferase family protein n=1 Tax=Mojavia pulchra JT2-VF2 TaxID=287848 RepID=A0A951Q6M7_9NOST|nr:gamma-glutamyltransferase family protein [Mojavia pulchra JT2-VF2]
MSFGNLTNYPYPSSRRVIMGSRGAVAASQPLATIAGMEMLWAGGSAVDAAIATAIALTVVEPTANGIGADAFALVWDGKLHGLNGSGKSPQKLSVEKFAGLNAVPKYDWRAVTVPGAVCGWRSLWERWGRLPFEQLFAPAIRYAESGFPVSPMVSLAWKRLEQNYLSLVGKEFDFFKEVFFPNHRAPNAGEIWHSPAHAQTLREIAATGGESFYRGNIAQRIADFAADTGGYLTLDDLAAHQAQWVQPISTNYRDLTVWEIPPNTQGIATLIGLNILSGFELSRYQRESAQSYHLQIEAMKLAFADVHRYIADEPFLQVPTKDLLSLDYADMRRALITEQALAVALPGLPKGGTVYLAAADGELIVSLIQSNFTGFGSGILPAGTGIALQNRGYGFTLDLQHPNHYAPNKRPFHTIIPGFLTQAHQPIGAFGVMGGAMQPQGHLQIVVNLADYGLNPQAALDAPRWQFVSDSTVLLEQTISQNIAQGLAQRGHHVLQNPDDFFGRGQIIYKQNQVLIAGSESRADGLALAW